MKRHADFIIEKPGYEDGIEVEIKSRVSKKVLKNGCEVIIHYSPRVKWKERRGEKYLW